MSDVGAMVAELIAAGCSPDVAARVVAGAFVAGVNSATFRGIPVDESAEKRRAYDRERKRNSAEFRRKSTESAEIPNTPLSSSNTDSRKRGGRLPENWTPSAEDRAFAKSIGWSDAQIDAEAPNFRDYWIAQPGQRGIKLDWPATWRKWARSSKVKPAGKPFEADNSPKLGWDEALASFKITGRWPRAAPASDIRHAPADLLAKHGLMADGRRVQ